MSGWDLEIFLEDRGFPIKTVGTQYQTVFFGCFLTYEKRTLPIIIWHHFWGLRQKIRPLSRGFSNIFAVFVTFRVSFCLYNLYSYPNNLLVSFQFVLSCSSSLSWQFVQKPPEISQFSLNLVARKGSWWAFCRQELQSRSSESVGIVF